MNKFMQIEINHKNIDNYTLDNFFLKLSHPHLGTLASFVICPSIESKEKQIKRFAKPWNNNRIQII